MSAPTLEARVYAALRIGPLYDGLVPLVVGASKTRTRRALRSLQTRGDVTFDGTTWRVTA